MENKNILVIILGFCLLIIGSFSIYKGVENKITDEKLTDREKFKKEYSEVDSNNVFVYRDYDQIIKIMENGTGIVYLGFPECPWCNSYVKYLNEAAKESGIDKIYYYNILNDRKEENDKYKKIVSLLGDNLQYDDEGNLRIYVPNVSFHVNGEIIFNDYESSKDTLGLTDPKEYWTEKRITSLKKRLIESMNKVKTEINVCTDCNK